MPDDEPETMADRLLVLGRLPSGAVCGRTADRLILASLFFERPRFFDVLLALRIHGSGSSSTASIGVELFRLYGRTVLEFNAAQKQSIS